MQPKTPPKRAAKSNRVPPKRFENAAPNRVAFFFWDQVLYNPAMTHTPKLLTLSDDAFRYFLSLLPDSIVSRDEDQVTVHAECGDALWFCRDGRWITAAPGFDAARRVTLPGVGTAYSVSTLT